MSGKNLEDNLPIAKPIIEFEAASPSEISDMIPGQTVQYDFIIKNTDGASQNEVAINYYIKVTYQNNNLPLTYKIYDITTGTEQELQVTDNQTSLIKMGYEDIENHKYRIKFTWPLSQNDVSYINKQIGISIEVFAEQDV